MGGKSKASALNAKSAAGGGGVVPQKGSVLPCCNHYIALKLVDEDGVAVMDVAVRMILTDGTDATAAFQELARQPDGSFKTQNILPAGDCEFALPDVQDVEWWPDGEAAPDVPADDSETIGNGECASSVADDYGYRNYLSLWKHAGNNTLATARPNPNNLDKGDKLVFPNKKKRRVKKATDQTWTLVVKKKRPANLRFVLFDRAGQPLNGLQWKMTAPVSKAGTTAADGLIEITGFPPQDTSGTLEVVMIAEPKAGKVADPAAAPLAYPPPILYSTFHDQVPPEPPGALEAVWNLRIGSLQRFDSREGVQARLGNIGFRCKPGDGDDATQRAVKAYQRLYNNQRSGSGLPGDIQVSVRDLHDLP